MKKNNGMIVKGFYFVLLQVERIKIYWIVWVFDF